MLQQSKEGIICSPEKSHKIQISIEFSTDHMISYFHQEIRILTNALIQQNGRWERSWAVFYLLHFNQLLLTGADSATSWLSPERHRVIVF